MKRIRRFPRRASDAHLLTPPDTKPFTCVLDVEYRLCPTPVQAALMREFGFRDHFSSGHIPNSHDVVQSLIRSGHAEAIHVNSYEGGCFIHLTRRPKLSKNTLDNLPPLIRQRLRHS